MLMANGVSRSLEKSEGGKLEMGTSGALPEQGGVVGPAVWVGVRGQQQACQVLKHLL